MAWTDGNVNGVENNRTVTVNGVARVNDIKFVNNVNGGNLLLIKTAGSINEVVYTSITPSYNQSNGTVLFEDVALNNTFDGGDDYYTWVVPTSVCGFGFIGADIDADGEISNIACVTP